MLFHNTIESSTLDLLKKIQSESFFENCRLVGGTALALQYGHRKSIDLDYCNVVFAATDLPFSCGKPLRGKHHVSIFLRTKKTGNSVLLAKKSIDMSAFSETVLKTEVYVGLDTSLYVVRTGMNIDWSKAKQLVLEDTNDTVYHYTAWYWDKSKECDEMPVEKCIVEIPDHWDLISNH
jgi:hypothetical protein